MKHNPKTDNWHKLTELEQLEYERLIAKMESERPNDEKVAVEATERLRGPVRLASPFEGLSL